MFVQCIASMEVSRPLADKQAFVTELHGTMSVPPKHGLMRSTGTLADSKGNAVACDTEIYLSCARPGGDRTCSMMSD